MVNIWVFNCAQYAAREIVKQEEGGRIINISSRAYLGIQEMAHYGASMAGGIRFNAMYGNGDGSIRNFGQHCGSWVD